MTQGITKNTSYDISYICYYIQNFLFLIKSKKNVKCGLASFVSKIYEKKSLRIFNLVTLQYQNS